MGYPCQPVMIVMMLLREKHDITLLCNSHSNLSIPFQFFSCDVSDGDFNDESPEDPISHRSTDKGENTATPDKLSTGK